MGGPQLSWPVHQAHKKATHRLGMREACVPICTPPCMVSVLCSTRLVLGGTASPTMTFLVSGLLHACLALRCQPSSSAKPAITHHPSASACHPSSWLTSYICLCMHTSMHGCAGWKCSPPRLRHAHMTLSRRRAHNWLLWSGRNQPLLTSQMVGPAPRHAAYKPNGGRIVMFLLGCRIHGV